MHRFVIDRTTRRNQRSPAARGVGTLASMDNGDHDANNRAAALALLAATLSVGDLIEADAGDGSRQWVVTGIVDGVVQLRPYPVAADEPTVPIDRLHRIRRAGRSSG